MKNITALIFIVLLICAQSTQLGFIQQEQQPNSICSDMSGPWYGLYHFYVPEANKFCLYTTVSDSYTTENVYDSNVTSQVILDTTQDQSCEDILSYFIARCLFDNGFVKQEVKEDSNVFKGQVQDGNLILAKFTTHYNRYSGWIQASQSIKNNQFNKRLSQVVSNISHYGLGSATCLELNGLWFGKHMVYNNNKDYNCVYDVTVYVQTTIRKMELHVSSISSSHEAGQQNSYVCEDLQLEIILDCDQDQQTLAQEQNGAGSFNMNFISIALYYIEDFHNEIILFRDE